MKASRPAKSMKGQTPIAPSAPVEAVVIGVSAGGLKALSAILPGLPRDYPLPVMICIHLPPGKKSIVAELFDEKCALDVHEAEDKEPIQPGTVYFAPPDYHLMVEPDRRLSLSSEEPVLFSRPSINVLFETAADAYGPGLLGIVLTGANNDGAQGLSTIMIAGGTAIIEDPADAYAAAMPQAAIDACPGARVMSLDDMATYLRSIGQAAEANT
jgi:two-component system, chemotaxis family, protein-glutamate methylesterase/glutaminase